MTMPRWVKLVVAVLVIIIGATVIWWQMSEDQATLSLNGELYHVTIMRTDAELQKGLSGTSSLPSGDGMLFVFPDGVVPVMWMKDMKYSIDMVWLNDDHQVVYTVENATPDSYPKKFQAPVSAHYVLELPSGTIKKTNIKNGEPAGLPSGV